MEDNDTLIMGVGRPKMDLHPEGGYFVSTKKTIEVQDINGKKYLVTVEEKG
jgi:predicted cupin superfamily sugar epimerase